MANATATQLQQLYVAYFGRAADPAGLDYWVGQGTTTKAFAASMYAQDEFESVNGSLSIELQVNQIYQNLFGRDGDSAGLIYWSNQIRTGALELASIANDLIYAVNNGSSETDKTALTNKTNTAIAYTADIRESATALLAYQPKSSSPWVTGENFSTAKTFLKTATATNTPSSAEVQASVDVISANSGNTATDSTDKTFTLTTGVDEPAASKYTKFDGSLTASGTQTLNSLDSLSGTTGTSDVLNATITSSVTPTKLDGIESVNITAGGTAVSLGLYNATGLTTLSSVGTTSSTSFTVNDADHTAITSFKVSDSTAPHIFNFKDTSSSVDSIAFSLSNYTGGTGAELTIPGIENITITSAGGTDSNNFELIAAALTTLTVKGTGGFDIDAVNLGTAGSTKVTTIDGSDATGYLKIATGALVTGTTDLTVTGGAGNDELDVSLHTANDNSVSGGAGNDIITIALAVDDTVAGGAGTDTLATSTVIAETGNVTGFEKLELTAAVSQDMDHLSVNTITTVVGGHATSSAFTDASADVVELELKDGMTGTYTVDRKTDTSSDSILVDLNGKNDVVTAVVLADEETITFENTNGGTAEVTTVTAGDATKIVVTGGYGTILDNVTSVDLVTFDSSAATGHVTFGYDAATSGNAGTIASEGNMTVTAGSGGLRFLSGTGDDTITGAAGADDITGAAGNDSIVGGAGNDTIVGDGGNDVLSGGTGEDTITTGSGNDNVTGGAGNDTITIAANYTTDDTVDGGAGTDGLNITGTSGGTVKPTTVTNIEEVTLTAAGTATNTLDLSETTGVNKITIANGVDYDTTVNAIESGATVVVNEGANVLQTLDTVAGATLSIDVGVTQTGTDGITVTDAANVTVTGKVRTGDIQKLVLDAVDTTSLTLTATSDNDLHVGAITGTDKITSLTMTSAATGGTVEAATFADADSLESITLTGVGGNIEMDSTIGNSGSAENLATITATATAGANIDLIGAITLDNTDSTTNLTTTITSSANGTDGSTDSSVAFGAITSTYGAITATTSGDGLTTFDELTAKGITVTGSGSGGTTLTDVTDTGTFNATFTGSGTNTVTASTATTATTIDGSGATGNNTFVSSATSNVTILGGSGADTLTANGTTASNKVHSVSGGAGNDTITGGDGADTLIGGDGEDSITAAAGNDSISGGAGNDTFVFAAATITSADTIDGGAGTDTVNITTATNLTNSAAPTLTNIEAADIEFTADSKSVDATGFTSLTDLTVGAASTYNASAINNLRSGVTLTINDADNDGIDIDTVAAASFTAKINAVMTGDNLTITDAASVTITNASASNGTTGALVLDAVDTTSLTVDSGALAGTLDTGNITNTDKLETLIVTSSTTSSTAIIGTIADADSLTSITLTAENANATTGAIGSSGTAEALSAITVTSTGTGVTATVNDITLDTTDSATDNALVVTSTANTGSAIDFNAINNQYGSYTENAVSHTDQDIDHAGTITAVAMTITTSGGGHHHYAGKLDASGAVSTTHSGSGNVTFADIDADGSSASVSVVATDLTGNLSAVASSSTVAATMTGGSGDDTITGGTKADTLTGNAGDDSLTGGEGNDTIAGGAGADTIKEGAGSGSITGGAGNDSITAGAGFDTIDAGTGDDTIIMGANVSLSDSVVGGDGNDTLTATISAATSNQKVGTLTGVENGTIQFDQTTGSFDATGSITTFTLDVAEASDTISVTNLTSSQTVKIVEASGINVGSTTLDYANDATATIEVGSTHDTGAVVITDAQTVNITSTGGAATAIGAVTLDETAETSAGGTDTFTIDVNKASSATTQTGAFGGAVVKNVTLTTSSTGAALLLGTSSTFIAQAAELETLTISAGGGGDTANDSDITITALGGGIAADEMTSISLTAADGADITTGAIAATGATLTSVTATASTTGSVIEVGGALTAGSLTTLTASAVSGATVDFSNDLDITTIGTISLSGAGTINLDDTDSVITTLERIDATGTSGTVVIDMMQTVGAFEANLGTGTSTLTVGNGNVTITLASEDGTDVIKTNDAHAGLTTIHNFEVGSASTKDHVALDLSGIHAGVSGLDGLVELPNNDIGNAAVAANDSIVYYSVSAGTVDLASATTASNVLVLGDSISTALDVALEANGAYAVTTSDANDGFEDGDGFLVLWSDGTDSYLTVAENASGSAIDNATVAANALTVTNLVQFKGIDDADNIVAGNWNAIF